MDSQKIGTIMLDMLSDIERYEEQQGTELNITDLVLVAVTPDRVMYRRTGSHVVTAAALAEALNIATSVLAIYTRALEVAVAKDEDKEDTDADESTGR